MKQLAICLAVFLQLSATAHAQSTFGVVLGTVKDVTGAVISGATIKLANNTEGTSREGKSNDKGDYEFQNVRPGNYSVTVSNSGFKASNMAGITLDARQTMRVDAILQVGEISQQVEVSSSAIGIVC